MNGTMGLAGQGRNLFDFGGNPKLFLFVNFGSLTQIVCYLVINLYLKNLEWILMKFYGGLESGS